MTFGLPTLLWLIYHRSHTGRPWSGDVIGGTGPGLIKSVETLPVATSARSLALASRRRRVCERDDGRYLFMTNRRDNP
jgi:hypothetical protein